MKTFAPTTAKWSRLLSLSAVAVALAACGKDYNGSSNAGSTPAPTATLSVAPTTITLGQSAKLTWTASAGTDCTASNGWTGAQQTNGSVDVTPTATGNVTYTLSCSGSGFLGTATQTATLTVQPASAYLATTLDEDFAGGTGGGHRVHLPGVPESPRRAEVVRAQVVPGDVAFRAECLAVFEGDGFARRAKGSQADPAVDVLAEVHHLVSVGQPRDGHWRQLRRHPCGRGEGPLECVETAGTHDGGPRRRRQKAWRGRTFPAVACPG